MNKRQTIQRSLILEAVRELKSHATADEVYKHVISKNPTISRGTVYRNLSLLFDMGEIHKVEIPNGADRYDHQCFNHYHILCTKCNNIFDVNMEYISDLDKCINNVQGFELTSHDIIFKGICPDCVSIRQCK